MKAREFLARKAPDLKLRNLIKEPLTVRELKDLAQRASGGAADLVAPKRRAEAEGLKGQALLEWLAADGGRVRRPIIDTGKQITLGFAAGVREELEAKL